MGDKMGNEYNKLMKQKNIMYDNINRMAGRSLPEALRDPAFSKKFINNQMYKHYISMNDSPIAQYQITKLDRNRALIDLEEYDSMLKATHEAVKKEARQAVEEAIEDFVKDFNR